MARGVKAASFVRMVCDGALSVCHEVATLSAQPQGRSLCDMHDEPEARYDARMHFNDREAQASDWHHVASDMKTALKSLQQKR